MRIAIDLNLDTTRSPFDHRGCPDSSLLLRAPLRLLAATARQVSSELPASSDARRALLTSLGDARRRATRVGHAALARIPCHSGLVASARDPASSEVPLGGWRGGGRKPGVPVLRGRTDEDLDSCPHSSRPRPDRSGSRLLPSQLRAGRHCKVRFRRRLGVTDLNFLRAHKCWRARKRRRPACHPYLSRPKATSQSSALRRACRTERW